MDQNTYPLCGKNKNLKSWVQKINEGNSSFNQKDLVDLQGASINPLRFNKDVPLRWLDSDPGFYILLRDKVQQKPKWFLNPNEYSFVPNKSLKTNSDYKKVLIITHHQPSSSSWAQIESTYPCAEIFWTSYSLKSYKPKWPEIRFLNSFDILFGRNLGFDAFFDDYYWQEDTLSPIHIHLLHNKASMLNRNYRGLQGEIFRKTFYGDFLLL